MIFKGKIHQNDIQSEARKIQNAFSNSEEKKHKTMQIKKTVNAIYIFRESLVRLLHSIAVSPQTNKK